MPASNRQASGARGPSWVQSCYRNHVYTISGLVLTCCQLVVRLFCTFSFIVSLL